VKTGYRKRVLALLERDPYVLMMAQRDGHGHVIGVFLHPDFVLGVEEMPLRIAITTMRRSERKVWLATEVGYIEDAKIVAGAPVGIERFVEPMSIEECAEYYGFTEGTVESYVQRARRHLKECLSGELQFAVSRASQIGYEALRAKMLQTD
jgi:hypothetical protein